MENEMGFFIYLIESYADYKNTSADVVMKFRDKLGLTDYIYDMYERYHPERIENAFEDIDRLVAKNNPKYMDE